MKTLLDVLDLTISEDYSDIIDAVDDIKDIIDELESRTAEDVQHTLRGFFDKTLRELQQHLIEDGRCPECGECLEEEVETETGYIDRKPAYQVSEVVGRYCPECGWYE